MKKNRKLKQQVTDLTPPHANPDFSNTQPGIDSERKLVGNLPRLRTEADGTHINKCKNFLILLRQPLLHFSEHRDDQEVLVNWLALNVSGNLTTVTERLQAQPAMTSDLTSLMVEARAQLTHIDQSCSSPAHLPFAPASTHQKTSH
ncbi:hypothetical protein RRG08_027048 [Elysia crispata]|uniref:Uncharacterized protein n=1 Tax=Elysia crispata TaxID=231223 RepID=A0AAE0ZHC6_9GAST|nr:hypothetical protein RRG08_027048 [Elysia crispata]